MKQIISYSGHLFFFLILFSVLILTTAGAETSTQYEYSTGSDFLDNITSPVSSVLSISSSTTTHSQSSSATTQSPGSDDPYGGIITENRLFLATGQHSQHLIRFDEYGQIQVQAQKGATFDLYSRKGATYPTADTFRTDYSQKVLVTSNEPVVLDVGPGIWVFTIDAPDQGGVFYLTAIQNSRNRPQTVSQSTSVSLQSVSLAEPEPTETLLTGV
ncbi:MAG TPA: hypothetical protein VN372_05480 [Methanospirillum sp.]|nr:hypothetical protein [Methanospirillum sp.]